LERANAIPIMSGSQFEVMFRRIEELIGSNLSPTISTHLAHEFGSGSVTYDLAGEKIVAHYDGRNRYVTILKSDRTIFTGLIDEFLQVTALPT
jgi:hypothetical protein